MLKAEITSAQSEALTNEYKGHLFEYLVAHELARLLGIERHFLENFGGEAKERLHHYEAWLREHARPLLTLLAQWSKQTAQEINKAVLFGRKFKSIYVVGKSTQGLIDQSFGEADLVLVDLKDSTFPLSLKLCQAHAYVNTKSGGVKSFLTKYFGPFSQALCDQEKMNLDHLRSFEAMAYDLHIAVGLEESLGQGLFTQAWKDLNLPELPGLLPTKLKERVHQNYQEMLRPLYEYLYSYAQENPAVFAQCLAPLLGFANPDVLQVSALYDKDQNLKLRFCRLDDFLSELPHLKFGELAPSKSSFDIFLGERILQIRLKPMNKFTQPAYKVNCSIK